MRKRIVKIYNTRFLNTNFYLFAKLLNELFHIKYSYGSIYAILTKAKIVSPEQHRVPKKNANEAIGKQPLQKSGIENALRALGTMHRKEIFGE